MPRTACLAVAAALAALPVLPAHADQAECEKTVRALLYPLDENKPDTGFNRFGTSVTKIAGQEMRGYSLQTPDGSLYYDQDKNPTSLSFSSGETYYSPDKGKTWTLANPNSKEVMDAAYAGLRSQAEKAENIVCEYGVDLDGKTVNHYSADYKLYNTGDPAHVDYWVDPENGFVWRDINHFKGAAETIVEVNAEPAPDMTLPAKPD